MNTVQHSKPFYKTKLFNLTLGVIVTAACLWWAFEQMLQGEDGRKEPSEVFAEIATAFRKADYWSLPVMWGCLALFYWLKAVRWQLLLEPIGRFRPCKELLPSVLTGFAFNNVLPAHLGEFVRVFMFSRQTGVARTAVLSTIVLERLFDIIAILAFLMLGLFLVDAQNLDPKVVTSAWIFGGVVCLGLVVAAVYLIWTRPVAAFIERRLERLSFIPPGIRERVSGMLESGAEGLASLRSVRLLTGIIVTSLLQWLLNGAIILLSLWAFGIETSAAVAAIVLGVTAFGVTVPSSPGYFGVIQLCFLLVLSLFVDNTEAVFAASIYYHMSQWIPVTIIGMYCFLRAGYRVSQIGDEKTENSDDGRDRDSTEMDRGAGNGDLREEDEGDGPVPAAH